MRFHNSRAIVKQDNNKNVQQNKLNPYTSFRMNLSQHRQNRNNEDKNVNVIHDVQISKDKKMKWGEAIWFLFHTLAEKIKEEHFQSKKYEMINIVKAICTNLPCPKCTDHATAYMKRLNIESIKIKQDWKDFLYKFHNEVNVRKNFVEFPYNELDSKYQNANTVNVINYFISVYKEKSNNVQMIATEMSRMRILRNTQQWLITNFHCFDT